MRHRIVLFPREAAVVAALLGAQTVVDTGAGASKAAALAALRSHDLVHVSTHGIHVPHFPGASALVLRDSPALVGYLRILRKTPDTWSPSDREQIQVLREEADQALLTVTDIAAAPVTARLVCLSACATGVAGVDPADEPIGLVPTLLAAGAAGVVASLWMIDADATETLMTEFYGKLLAAPGGRPDPAGALRAAMMAVMRSRPHPYYWAPFALTAGLASAGKDSRC